MAILMSKLTGVSIVKPRRRTGYQIWRPTHAAVIDRLVDERAEHPCVGHALAARLDQLEPTRVVSVVNAANAYDFFLALPYHDHDIRCWSPLSRSWAGSSHAWCDGNRDRFCLHPLLDVNNEPTRRKQASDADGKTSIIFYSHRAA